MKHTLFAGLLALGLTGAAWAEKHLAVQGNLELRAEAMPTNTLSAESAQAYKVQPAADRGLLVVTVMKSGKTGQLATVPAQVYAGAMTQSNFLLNIPLREVQVGNSVYYLGEFRITPPDVLRFLVNANVLGTPLKAEFSRSFPTN